MLRDRINEIRKDFPYLEINNGKIIYFDNAATTQKPIQIINKYSEYYKKLNGNPHRGAHYLAMKATEVYEEAREFIKDFLGANSSEEIVFLRNATEALNLIAYSYALNNLSEGDEVLISIMEHHSNLIPWQEACKKRNAKLNYLYLDKDMQINSTEFENKLSQNTKLVALTAASNVVGTMPDLKQLIKKIRTKSPKAKIVIDAAQYIPHRKINVSELDCDFLVFSGHKMLAPMGIGVLYGKKHILNEMEPFLYGGDMIEYVYEDSSSYLNAPARFEAGTQNVGGAYALKAAIEYMQNIGIEEIEKYEAELTNYCYDKMKKLDYIDIYTTSNINRSPLVAFNFKEVHPHDVASILDTKGVAIRSGHHCAQPLHRYLGSNFSCRASFAFYNTFEEIDRFIEALELVKEVMGIGIS